MVGSRVGGLIKIGFWVWVWETILSVVFLIAFYFIFFVLGFSGVEKDVGGNAFVAMFTLITFLFVYVAIMFFIIGYSSDRVVNKQGSRRYQWDSKTLIPVLSPLKR